MKFKTTSYIQIILLFKEQNSKLSQKIMYLISNFTTDISMQQNLYSIHHSYKIIIKIAIFTIFISNWCYCVPSHEKLEAQWAEPVSLTFHSALRKLYTEPSIVLPTKFRFIRLLIFKGEDYLEIDQSETRITYGGHVC